MLRFSYFLVLLTLLILTHRATATESDDGNPDEHPNGVPKTVYRGDLRSPEEIKVAGGFHPQNPPPNPVTSDEIIDHVDNESNKFVSTTEDANAAKSYIKDKGKLVDDVNADNIKKGGTGNGKEKGMAYIYHIDTAHNPSQYHSVLNAFLDKGKSDSFQKELEYASAGSIPWSTIRKVEKVEDGFKVRKDETREEIDLRCKRDGSSCIYKPKQSGPKPNPKKPDPKPDPKPGPKPPLKPTPKKPDSKSGPKSSLKPPFKSIPKKLGPKPTSKKPAPKKPGPKAGSKPPFKPTPKKPALKKPGSKPGPKPLPKPTPKKPALKKPVPKPPLKPSPKNLAYKTAPKKPAPKPLKPASKSAPKQSPKNPAYKPAPKPKKPTPPTIPKKPIPKLAPKPAPKTQTPKLPPRPAPKNPAPKRPAPKPAPKPSPIKPGQMSHSRPAPKKPAPKPAGKPKGGKKK